MTCRSCRPKEGRIDGAHGAAAVTKERQGRTTLTAEPLRPSLGRPDRYIVRTERRYPLHAPEPARRGGLAVSGKSSGPRKIRGSRMAILLHDSARASFTARDRDPSLRGGRTYDERGGRRAEHCGEHRRVAHLERPCEARSRQPSRSGRHRITSGPSRAGGATPWGEIRARFGDHACASRSHLAGRPGRPLRLARTAPRRDQDRARPARSCPTEREPLSAGSGEARDQTVQRRASNEKNTRYRFSGSGHSRCSSVLPQIYYGAPIGARETSSSHVLKTMSAA